MGDESTASASRVASLKRRLLAWIADAGAVGVLFTPILLLIDSSTPDGEGRVMLVVISVVIPLVYLVVSDASTCGATLGKRALGIRVVDASTGGALNYRRAAARRVAYLIGGLVFYAGWLRAIFDERNRAWHDKVANTLVVHRT